MQMPISMTASKCIYQTQVQPSQRLALCLTKIKDKWSTMSFGLDYLINDFNNINFDKQQNNFAQNFEEKNIEKQEMLQQKQQNPESIKQIIIENQEEKNITFIKGVNQTQSDWTSTFQMLGTKDKTNQLQLIEKQKQKQQQVNVKNQSSKNQQQLQKGSIDSLAGLLMQKQSDAFQQLFSSFASMKIQQSFQSQSQKYNNSKETVLDGQILQLKQKPNQKLQRSSNLLDAKRHVQNLQNQYKKKIYNHGNIQNFIFHVMSIYNQNISGYFHHMIQIVKKTSVQSRSRILTQSSDKEKQNRKSQIQSEFNLQLTMKSVKSKQLRDSIGIDRQDSLLYSNATEFPLKSTQNHSIKSIRQKQFVIKNIPSNNIKHTESKQDIEFGFQIDRASSKGQVQPSDKEYDELETAKNKHYQNKIQNITHLQKPEPLNNNHQKLQKSFSIKTYNNKTKNDLSRVNNQQNSRVSVFSSEIQNSQQKIHRIKQEKILKKKKLEEELKKINKQIQNLKEQEQAQFQANQYNNEKKQIDSQQAIEFISRLKEEKLNRQFKKRTYKKVLDQDLHKKMEDIVKLRYFNEKTVKQSKKIQVIQRMKRQQLRKIAEQQQKKKAVEFTIKLNRQKHPALPQIHHNIKTNNQTNFEQAKKQDQLMKLRKQIHQSRKKTNQSNLFESPHKVSDDKKITEQKVRSDALNKKKSYQKRIKGFTILKDKSYDIYQQSLN